MNYTKFIEEHVVEGKRLGRHVNHDPLSRNWAYEAVRETTLREVHHRRYGSAFMQTIGSCTGEAAAGACNTVPLHIPGHKLLTQADALSIYERATVLDPFDGSYPPDDTGSDGLSAAKALKELGLITEYRHAFSVDQALTALQERPFIFGTNWYEGMDDPDDHHFVKIAGQIRGGHEFEIKGFIPRISQFDSILVCENSWGTDWGWNGTFYLRVRDFSRLVDEEGDVTILIR